MKKKTHDFAGISAGRVEPKTGRAAELEMEIREVQLQIMKQDLRERIAKARQAEILADHLQITLAQL